VAFRAGTEKRQNSCIIVTAASAAVNTTFPSPGGLPVTRFALVGGLAFSISSARAGDPPALTVAPSKLFPNEVSVMVFASGKGAPGRKGEAPVLKVERVRFGQAVELAGSGPFDVYLVPEFTYAVQLREKWTPKPGANELKPADELGAVRVRPDGLPRAETILLTKPDDPGPGDPKHAPVQGTRYYDRDLFAKPGTYTVWVVPANGARAQKAAEKVRVQAGKVTTAPEG
jgi:hypothetical protein